MKNRPFLSDRPKLGTVATGWQEVKLHYNSTHPPAQYEFYSLSSSLRCLWRSPEGQQLWAVGEHGTILHYTAQTESWEAQSSGTTNLLFPVFGSSDGTQLWAIGMEGTILHYSALTGRWEAQSSGTTHSLVSVFGSGDGAQLWAVGTEGRDDSSLFGADGTVGSTKERHD